MLVHKLQISGWVLVMPPVTRRTHRITVPQIEPDDEVAARVEVRALKIPNRAARHAFAISQSDYARRLDV
jgi:hypothetical protein